VARIDFVADELIRTLEGCDANDRIRTGNSAVTAETRRNAQRR
jgi:hypothetical protein